MFHGLFLTAGDREFVNSPAAITFGNLVQELGIFFFCVVRYRLKNSSTGHLLRQMLYLQLIQMAACEL